MPVESEIERTSLVEFLGRRGCEMIRETNKHLFYCNPAAKRFSSVPRQDVIGQALVAKILSDLDLSADGL